jgi:hypothetical protein
MSLRINQFISNNKPLSSNQKIQNFFDVLEMAFIKIKQTKILLGAFYTILSCRTIAIINKNNNVKSATINWLIKR